MSLIEKPSTFQRIHRALAHWQNNHRVRKVAQSVPGQLPHTSNHKPVVFFNASTRLSGMSLNAGFSLVASWALRLAGVPVVHFVCERGLRPCVLGTHRDQPDMPPPCNACQQQSRVFFTAAEVYPLEYLADNELNQAVIGLRLEDLMQFDFQGLPLGALVLPSIRWILRRHHLDDDEPTHRLFRQYIQSAWSLAKQFERMLDKVDPQAVVVFNGMFYPEATARFIAQRRGLRVISHEVALRPFTAFFTTGEATAYPIDVPPELELTPEQDARLDEYLGVRFQGKFSMAGIQFWREMQTLDDAVWKRAAEFSQIVPIFTNVVFDTSQGHANVVFPDMFAWLDRVLAIIRRHPETFFVIRAHPDECRPGKESRQSVADWAARNRVTELQNVLFVEAREYFSSYEMIQRSKFVVVYNSTIGLEASIMGSAVLCGGKARFTQLPTVFFPPTPEAFEQKMEEMLRTETIMLPVEFRRNARRFLYYQLFKTALSFEDFLSIDPNWQGYVLLKPFSMQALLPAQNPAIHTLLKGILDGSPFLVDE